MINSNGMLRAGVAALVFLQAGIACAAEIKVLTVFGMRAVMNELGPMFERASGHKLAFTMTTLGGALKSVQSGDLHDVAVVPRHGMDQFIQDGKVRSDDVSEVARSSMGVAVRKGAPRPDISSTEAFKLALLSAKSLTYANPAHGAASGIHFAKVLDSLGIADRVKPKTVFLPKAGPVAVLVAKGEAEIAVHQIQEMMPVAGIDIVGPLPRELQEVLIFAAALMRDGSNSSAARSFVDFLRSPETAGVIKAKGMEPGDDR
jgi:molybdate transport system substrate-binding protein